MSAPNSRSSLFAAGPPIWWCRIALGLGLFGVFSLVISEIRVSPTLSDNLANRDADLVRVWLWLVWLVPLGLTSLWLSRSAQKTASGVEAPLALALVDVLSLALTGRHTTVGRASRRAAVKGVIDAVLVAALLWAVLSPFHPPDLMPWLGIVALASGMSSYFWERARPHLDPGWLQLHQPTFLRYRQSVSPADYEAGGQLWAWLAVGASASLGIVVLGGFALMFW